MEGKTLDMPADTAPLWRAMTRLTWLQIGSYTSNNPPVACDFRQLCVMSGCLSERLGVVIIGKDRPTFAQLEEVLKSAEEDVAANGEGQLKEGGAGMVAVRALEEERAVALGDAPAGATAGATVTTAAASASTTPVTATAGGPPAVTTEG